VTLGLDSLAGAQDPADAVGHARAADQPAAEQGAEVRRASIAIRSRQLARSAVGVVLVHVTSVVTHRPRDERFVDALATMMRAGAPQTPAGPAEPANAWHGNGSRRDGWLGRVAVTRSPVEVVPGVATARAFVHYNAWQSP
jgi:hypothetical protein